MEEEEPHDAFAYLKAVQERTSSTPHLFTEFLEVLRIFREEGNADMKLIASRIVEILGSFPDLVLGFNSFLPDGFEIVEGENGFVVKDTIDVVGGNEDLPANEVLSPPVTASVAPSVHNSVHDDPNSLGLTMNDARNFLSLLRQRAEDTSKPSLYKRFKEIMKKQMPLSKLTKQVQSHFKGYPELQEEFNKFLRDEWKIEGGLPPVSSIMGMEFMHETLLNDGHKERTEDSLLSFPDKKE